MPFPQLRAVLDAAVDAAVVIDRAGRILLVNRATEALFGWSATEMRGRDVRTLMPEPDRGAHAGYITEHLAIHAPRATGRGRDVQAQRRDGSCFPAHLSIGRVDGVEPPEFIGFIHDLSDRQREKEDARHLNQRLMQVTRMATMGEMAAGIAHELNQPLTAITNYALAADRFLGFAEPDLAEAQEALREISAEVRRAADIIRKLRRITRASDASHERTDLRELIGELQTLCLADARANDTRLRFEIAPALPLLLIHRLQITQVLLNLIRNALESLAAEPAGTREVTVSVRRTATGDCEIAVSDNGAGVAPGILDRMFEPFHSTKPNGTGLGLPMGETIAQAHGGTLRHEPAIPRGARFVLTLPAADTVQ